MKLDRRIIISWTVSLFAGAMIGIHIDMIASSVPRCIGVALGATCLGFLQVRYISGDWSIRKFRIHLLKRKMHRLSLQKQGLDEGLDAVREEIGNTIMIQSRHINVIMSCKQECVRIHDKYIAACTKLELLEAKESGDVQ